MTNYCWLGFIITCGSLVLGIGCSGRSKAPEAVAIEQVAPTMQEAFKQAAPEVKDAAGEVVNALAQKENPKAFLDLQTLSSKPELTDDQRMVVTRALLSVNEQLRDAAARGDQQAAQVLELHRARK